MFYRAGIMKQICLRFWRNVQPDIHETDAQLMYGLVFRGYACIWNFRKIAFQSAIAST